MRKGVPMAGNHLMQELIMMTGALEAMVVDYQCIMPSVTDVARCFHTQIISTSDKAKFPGAVHVPFDPKHGLEIGKEIVRRAIAAYPNRNPDRVRIPDGPVPSVGESERPRDATDALRIVVTGKGGVGKTTISAAIARTLARGDRRVLAVDADAQLNLAAALGMPRKTAESLVPLSRNAEYIAEKTGARPGDGYGLLFRLNPDVDDVVDRFGERAPDGVRFLAMGTLSGAGAGCLCPENTLLTETIRALALQPDEAIVMDTQAGVEHFGRAIARGFNHAVVVTDPTYSGVGVALAAARLGRELGIQTVHLVVNRVRGPADRARIEDELAARDRFGFATMTWIPDDDLVLATEPSVDFLFDIPGEPFIAAVGRLTAALARRRVGAAA